MHLETSLFFCGSTSIGHFPKVVPWACIRPAPFGLGVDRNNLWRIARVMIRNYLSKSSRGWVASVIILTLGALMALSPTLAGDDDP